MPRHHRALPVTTPPRKALPPVPVAAPPGLDEAIPPPLDAPAAPSRVDIAKRRPPARPGPSPQPAHPSESAPPAHASQSAHAPNATTHAAPLYIAADASRRERRVLRKRARGIEAAARQAALDEKRTAIAAERDERRAAAYLPRAGEEGPDALRSYRPLRVQQHRATSEVLAGAYPFLAEAGLGSDGIYIGTDSYSAAGFCFDPWVLYARGEIGSPNILLAGQLRAGKSTLAKCLATRSMAFGRRVYVPGDPKGEWARVTRHVGGSVIELGPGTAARVNPLEEGLRPRFAPSPDGQRVPMTDGLWAETVTARRNDLLTAIAEATLKRPLRPVEATALSAALDTAAHAHTHPLLPHVVDALFDPVQATRGSSREQLITDGRDVAHTLQRMVRGDLAGLFDGPSTAVFDPSTRMVSVDLSRYGIFHPALALVMTVVSAWMDAALYDPDAGQRLVVYDEAWRLIAEPSLLTRMQSQWKLSRALGISNLLVIHRLSDLAAVGDEGSAARAKAQGLLADCDTRIIYNQPQGEAEKTGAGAGLSPAEARHLPGLERGEGLWKIKERAFMVRNVCTPGELELFDTDARMAG